MINLIKKLFTSRKKECLKEKQDKALKLLAERMRELRTLRGNKVGTGDSTGSHGS